MPTATKKQSTAKKANRTRKSTERKAFRETVMSGASNTVYPYLLQVSLGATVKVKQQSLDFARNTLAVPPLQFIFGSGDGEVYPYEIPDSELFHLLQKAGHVERHHSCRHDHTDDPPNWVAAVGVEFNSFDDYFAVQFCDLGERPVRPPILEAQLQVQELWDILAEWWAEQPKSVHKRSDEIAIKCELNKAVA